MKRRLFAFFLAAVLLLCLAGCGAAGQKSRFSGQTVRLTMYLWDKSMTKELTPWLEEQFPEIEFTFVVAGSYGPDYYKDLLQYGELPDILTCRRFSLNDAAGLEDALLDLSGTELAGTFYEAILENNRDHGGAVRWLPMGAEVEGIIVNRQLIRKYNLERPTNYREFADLCRAFERYGLDCFYTDLRSDQACLSAMQGSAIPELMSLAGTRWRAAYENQTPEEPVGLDKAVWPVVMERFEQFLRDTRLGPDDLEMTFAEARQRFCEGSLAMLCGTGSDCIALVEDGMDAIMLPYFGEEEKDNWLLTYPLFQVAVNRSVEQDPVKKSAALAVLEAMFSAEGQACAAAGSTVLTYNRTVEMSLDESLVFTQNCVTSNHLYQRLSSRKFFAISQDVTEKLIRGAYDAQGAYEDFNAQLLSDQEETPAAAASLTQGYALALQEHGSEAVSAVANTLRRQLGADLLVGYSSLLTSSVHRGEYTVEQLDWLLDSDAELYAARLTGRQVLDLMDWLVNVKKDGANPIRYPDLIPVTSGMEYGLCDEGGGRYRLQNVTRSGETLDLDASYTVVLLGAPVAIESSAYCSCPMPEELRAALVEIEGAPVEHLAAALADGAQMEPPTEYVTFYD